MSITILGAVLLVITVILSAPSGADEPPFVTPGESPKTYYLENAYDKDKFERMTALTLYSDGTALLPQPMISSFLLMPCKYAVVSDELFIYTEDIGSAVAVFTVEDDSTLVFKSKTVPIFADIGARYIHEAQK